MEVTQKVKENFFHSVKGVFSSPINNSLKNLEQLLSTTLTDEQTELIHALDKHLVCVHRNTQNLEYLSDIKRDELLIQLKPFSLLYTFEKIVKSFQYQADLAGIHLLAYIDPTVPKEIVSDENHIIQILENLILNAIMYTSRGGSVYIDLKTESLSETNVRIDVSVSDTGRGISRENIKEYLQPFSHSGEGSLGVGLSTSFQILKAMGSQLKIASEVSKGSRFSFSLDVQASSAIMFESQPDIKIGVLIEERSLFVYAKILYQYIMSMGLSVATIKDKNDTTLKECQGVFIVTDSCESLALSELSESFKEICFIPAVPAREVKNRHLHAKQAILYLPAMPSNIHKSMKYIKSYDRQTQVKEDKVEKVKILVAEDNPINLKLINVVLARYNFQIDSAQNGRIAFNMCKKERYSMVLMDIDMPVMDGITATKSIREYEDASFLNHTPIIALTSHDLEVERSEIIASGLDEHMSKPLNVTRLESMLEHYLGFKLDISKYKEENEN